MAPSFSFGLVLQIIKQFRDEELHHHDVGLEHNAEQVRLLSSVCPNRTLALTLDWCIRPFGSQTRSYNACSRNKGSLSWIGLGGAGG